MSILDSLQQVCHESIAQEHALVLHDRRLTICEIPEEAGILYGSYQAILTKHFGMKYFSAKFIPWLLRQEETENYLFI
jgi:hypothetical protein